MQVTEQQRGTWTPPRPDDFKSIVPINSPSGCLTKASLKIDQLRLNLCVSLGDDKSARLEIKFTKCRGHYANYANYDDCISNMAFYGLAVITMVICTLYTHHNEGNYTTIVFVLITANTAHGGARDANSDWIVCHQANYCIIHGSIKLAVANCLPSKMPWGIMQKQIRPHIYTITTILIQNGYRLTLLLVDIHGLVLGCRDNTTQRVYTCTYV